MGNPVSEAEARRAARRAQAAGARSCFPVPVPQQTPGVWTGAPSCSPWTPPAAALARRRTDGDGDHLTLQISSL